MTSPAPDPTPPPEPGDRPPPGSGAGRLARPPSDRYVAREPGVPGVGGDRGRADAIRTLAPAIGASVVTAAALVLVGGVLAEQTGLLAIAGLGGALIGLLAASAAVTADGARPPVLSRARAVRVAIGLALVAVAAGALGTWAYGRLEGGVLDPLTYLWNVFGLFIPAEAAIGALAAAWGAGAGPIRSGS